MGLRGSCLMGKETPCSTLLQYTFLLYSNRYLTLHPPTFSPLIFENLLPMDHGVILTVLLLPGKGQVGISGIFPQRRNMGATCIQRYNNFCILIREADASSTWEIYFRDFEWMRGLGGV